MERDKVFRQFDGKIQPDRAHAQILMEINTSTKTFEEAKKIIEDSGISIIKVKQLSSDCILLKLNVRDMRNLVLKLIENGFSNIRGVNATDVK